MRALLRRIVDGGSPVRGPAAYRSMPFWTKHGMPCADLVPDDVVLLDNNQELAVPGMVVAVDFHGSWQLYGIDSHVEPFPLGLRLPDDPRLPALEAVDE